MAAGSGQPHNLKTWGRLADRYILAGAAVGVGFGPEPKGKKALGEPALRLGALPRSPTYTIDAEWLENSPRPC